MRSLEEIVHRNGQIAKQYIRETPPRVRLENRLRSVTAYVKYPIPEQKSSETFADFIARCRNVGIQREAYIRGVLAAFDQLQTPESREWFANLDDPGWTQFPTPAPAERRAVAQVA